MSMDTTSVRLDAHQKPPEQLKALFKKYQKATKHDLDNDASIIDLEVLPEGAHAGVKCVGTTSSPQQLDNPLHETGHVGLCQGMTRKNVFIYEVRALPGLMVIPSSLSPTVQIQILNRLLHRDLVNTNHRTNLHLHYDMSLDELNATASEKPGGSQQPPNQQSPTPPRESLQQEAQQEYKIRGSLLQPTLQRIRQQDAQLRVQWQLSLANGARRELVAWRRQQSAHQQQAAQQQQQVQLSGDSSSQPLPRDVHNVPPSHGAQASGDTNVAQQSPALPLQQQPGARAGQQINQPLQSNGNDQPQNAGIEHQVKPWHANAGLTPAQLAWMDNQDIPHELFRSMQALPNWSPSIKQYGALKLWLQRNPVAGCPISWIKEEQMLHFWHIECEHEKRKQAQRLQEALPWRKSLFSADMSTTFQPKDPHVHKELSLTQVLEKKLRWVTLGGQYDWTAKAYPRERPPFFPSDIAAVLKLMFPFVEPQAAILNLYSPGDTLSVHRDVSEECDRGLISLSFGCEAIFVVGNEDGSKTATIRLRSGDGLLMSNPSRFAWHGVPKVLAGTCPEWLEDWPMVGADGSSYENWKGWMAGKRINLNVRQMSEHGISGFGPLSPPKHARYKVN